MQRCTDARTEAACSRACCVPPGVDTDLEESQEVLKFAKQLEILNKGEAGNLKVRRLA